MIQWCIDGKTSLYIGGVHTNIYASQCIDLSYVVLLVIYAGKIGRKLIFCEIMYTLAVVQVATKQI